MNLNYIQKKIHKRAIHLYNYVVKFILKIVPMNLSICLQQKKIHKRAINYLFFLQIFKIVAEPNASINAGHILSYIHVFDNIETI